jgi:hypothetical protein
MGMAAVRPGRVDIERQSAQADASPLKQRGECVGNSTV